VPAGRYEVLGELIVNDTTTASGCGWAWTLKQRYTHLVTSTSEL
jgi:hypothetical protein